jgi:hypothetical protein
MSAGIAGIAFFFEFISNATDSSAYRAMFFIAFNDDITFPELCAALVTMAVALILSALEDIPVRPFHPVREMLALFANFSYGVVRTLAAGGVTALLTFAVYIPISASSAQLPFTGSVTYTGEFIIDPVSAFSLAFKNPCSAGLTENIIGPDLFSDAVSY